MMQHWPGWQSADVWQAMVRRAVDRSFNAITVDGDTSTNDTYLAFAAGEPLAPEHVKPRLLGHWGTSPGLNLIYVHLNRLIRARAKRTNIHQPFTLYVDNQECFSLICRHSKFQAVENKS